MDVKIIFIFLILLFSFSNVSAYSLEYNHTTEQILFIPEINETINYNGSIYYSFPINLNFSNISDNKIDISFNFIEKMMPYNYTGFITIVDNMSVKNLDIYKNIKEVMNYSILPTTNVDILYVENVSLTEQKNILNVTLRNTGNSDINFDFLINNKSDILYIQPSIVLQKFQNFTIPIIATIPINYKTGVFNDSLIIFDGFNISYINFSYIISDNILPKIIEFSVSDTNATMSSKIYVKASDNVEVDSVLAVINTPNNEDFSVMLEKRSDHYYGLFKKTDLVGAYTVKIIVYDVFENLIENTTSMNVFKLDVVSYSKHVEALPSIIPKFKIFELTDEIPINISFDRVDYKGNWSVEIEKPNGQRVPIENINDSVNINDIGIYYMYFYGDLLSNISDSSSEGNLFGIINLTSVEQHIDINEITFSSVLVTYSLADEFYVDLGLMNGLCTPKDGGNLETSKITCSFNYPPETTKFGLNLLITEDMYNRIVNDKNELVYETTKDKNSLVLQKWFLMILLIFSWVGMFVYYYVLPYYSSD